MLWIDVLETTTGNMIWWGRHGFDKQFQGRVPVCGWKLNWKKKEEVRYLQSGSNKSLVWPLGHELIVSYTLNSCYPNHILAPPVKMWFSCCHGNVGRYAAWAGPATWPRDFQSASLPQRQLPSATQLTGGWKQHLLGQTDYEVQFRLSGFWLVVSQFGFA